ncbi:MAG: HNH endonuclease signature motif containing protein [Alkalibacterium sp.]|uniref:HNH endonuclease signature motif containing protein n=1 Tax=Alkalibacterium sp. TaxID=1872447 RepID=UPI003970ADF9
MTDFKRELECVYKDEHYSVRDNGAVLRHARKGKRLRKYDNQWTFGKPNNNGYMLIVSEVVHRIVAYAFLGEPPTPQHIVDHIDTNRQNNRPENLRWLTKLENILNNPITVKRIVHHCGSIEAFLKDPSILHNHINVDPNFEWMRTVTPEEARTSWQRLSEWTKKENDSTSSKGGSLGEWIFKDNLNYSSSQETPGLVTSETPNAIQKEWRTPSEFPCCPQESTDNPIESYAANLKIGEIFSRNKYSYSIILDYATSGDGNTLWVMCKNSDDNAIKPWSLAQVTYENKLFVHTNLGSFFENNGAEKQFILAQGLEWTGGDSIDDYS